MDKNLRALCNTAMGHERTVLKSMTLLTDMYKTNRQVLVKRHSKSLCNPHLEKPHRFKGQMLIKTISKINSVRAHFCRASSAVIQEPHLTTKVLVHDVTETRSCSPPSPATARRTIPDRGKESQDNFLGS